MYRLLRTLRDLQQRVSHVWEAQPEFMKEQPSNLNNGDNWLLRSLQMDTLVRTRKSTFPMWHIKTPFLQRALRHVSVSYSSTTSRVHTYDLRLQWRLLRVLVFTHGNVLLAD